MSKLVKPLFALLWTIGCYFSFRLVMYKYWAFDVIQPKSWNEMISLWHAGKIFPWMFIFALVFVIPVWIIGLMFIKKHNIVGTLKKIFTFSFLVNKKKKIQNMAKKTVKIKKKKSYTDIRPPALKPVMGAAFTTNPRKSIEDADQIMNGDINLDDENNETDSIFSPDTVSGSIGDSRNYNEDLPFGDDFDKEMQLPATTEAPQTATIQEVIEQSGYKVVTDVNVGDTTIDYIALSNNAVVLCFEENTQGNWLADEERFNDGEPLWFSESAQRVSPVHKAIQIKNKISDAILEVLPETVIVPVLIISKGSIMNAVDMLDTWEELQVFVGRFGEGGPADLKRLSNLLPPGQSDNIDDEIMENVKKSIISAK